MATREQEEFLNRIAGKLGRPRRSGVKPPVWRAKPYAHLHEKLDQEGLVQQFIENLRMLRTQVLHIPPEEMEWALQQIFQETPAHSVVYWDDERLHKLGLSRLLDKQGVVHRSWDTSVDEQELRNDTAGIEMGIAYAELGLSETGTVMLWNGGGRGRLVSLLPPVFVVILSEKAIMPRLTEATAYVHEKVPDGLPACLNFITGPSRTGDIEMDLAFGVHGPGKVHVILLKE
ncbi:lactate utilization protein C [Aneurinibacillus migulanus]|uniref:LutC/YkgG family protein n=1 Tax=Aneurinibacillus migulanus TaxID=47500 RepID=UPI002E20D2CB|nr:lactate utilization protein C [Aneurinibacillus migulanus]